MTSNRDAVRNHAGQQVCVRHLQLLIPLLQLLIQFLHLVHKLYSCILSFLHTPVVWISTQVDLHTNTLCIYRNNKYNHTLTSSGLYWVSACTNPIRMPLVCMVGRLSKIWAYVVTPFSVGGGFRSANGAFGTKP